VSRSIAASAERDTLFATGPVAPFRFDADVARVFPDMLDRSIPGYASIVAQTGLIAARFAQPDTHLYDLGCSLAASALAMRSALTVPAAAGRADEPAANPRATPDARTQTQTRTRTRTQTQTQTETETQTKTPPATPSHGQVIADSCRIVGVDNSPAMLERAAGVVEEHRRATPADALAPALDLHEADLAAFPLEPASVVAMNFTLQFVAPDARTALLTRIADALLPGGVLVLSEKVRFADPELDALHIDMYHAFKRANGYSALEVARKRAALEDVLVPDTLPEHEARLRTAGFTRIGVWFQCFNFASLIAIR